MMSVISVPMVAQVVMPAVTFDGARPSNMYPTATEAWVNSRLADQRMEQEARPAMQTHSPRDSMRTVSIARARAWVIALQASPVVGLHQDAYAVLAAKAELDTIAQQYITARLAAPGLSLADRAYTLQMAVTAFASVDVSARLPIAERYLQKLDAMGPKVALWQLGARKPLIYAYYRLGRSADVARIGTQMFDLVRVVPFAQRGEAVYNSGISFTYAAVVDALGSQPHGLATIHAMNAALLAATFPPPDIIAHDSVFRYIGETYRTEVNAQINLAERVGQAAKPLSANYWVNRGPSRDSQQVAVADGTIRVLEIGSFTCSGCIAAVPALERLHRRYPAVEFNFLTAATGVWGNRIVAPTIEAEHLAEHFTKVLHATFPIGIAIPTQHVPTDDDGEAAVITTPTWHAGNYPQTGKPTFYIVDGAGTIRRVMAGYNRDLEEHLATIIEFLTQEARRAAPLTAPN